MSTEIPSNILEIAASLGFPIAEVHRDGVTASFEALARQASLVMAFPLSELGNDSAEFEP